MLVRRNQNHVAWTFSVVAWSLSLTSNIKTLARWHTWRILAFQKIPFNDSRNCSMADEVLRKSFTSTLKVSFHSGSKELSITLVFAILALPSLTSTNPSVTSWDSELVVQLMDCPVLSVFSFQVFRKNDRLNICYNWQQFASKIQSTCCLKNVSMLGRFFAAMTWPPQCQCVYLLIVVFCYPAFHVWKAFASNHLSPSCNHGIILLLYLLMILLDLVVCKSTIINIITITRWPTSIIIVPWRKTFPSLSLPSLPTFSLAQNIIWLGWGWAL